MKATRLILIFSVLCLTCQWQMSVARQTKAPVKPNPVVKIYYDKERQFYYIATAEKVDIVKVLPYKKVYQFKEGMAKVVSDEGIGYINEKGKEIVAPDGKFNWGKDFSEGMAAVGTDSAGTVIKAGFVNKSGVLVIPLKYQNAWSFSENMAVVEKNGKLGYINKTGVLVIPAQYLVADFFKCGVAAVAKELTEEENVFERFGYIDKTGKQVIPFIYSEAGKFRKTFGSENAIVERNGNVLLINKKGMENDFSLEIESGKTLMGIEWAWDDGDELILSVKERYKDPTYGVYSLGSAGFLIKPIYGEITPLKEPVTESRFYHVAGFYNAYGLPDNHIGLVKYISCEIPAEYDHISFHDGLVYALKDIRIENEDITGGKFFLYDRDLKLLTPESYDWIASFTNGYAQVLKNGMVGIINMRGDEVIPAVYDATGEVQYDLVPVLKGDKAGVLNIRGDTIIPLVYENIMSFKEGYALYKLNGRYGIVDTTGRKVTEPLYEEMGAVCNGLALIIQNNKVGFINTKGDIVIPAQYDDGNSFSDSVAWVVKDGLVGFIDTKGNTVLPFKYEKTGDFKKGCALVQENGVIMLINKKGVVLKTN